MTVSEWDLCPRRLHLRSLQVVSRVYSHQRLGPSSKSFKAPRYLCLLGNFSSRLWQLRRMLSVKGPFYTGDLRQNRSTSQIRRSTDFGPSPDFGPSSQPLNLFQLLCFGTRRLAASKDSHVGTSPHFPRPFTLAPLRSSTKQARGSLTCEARPVTCGAAHHVFT